SQAHSCFYRSALQDRRLPFAGSLRALKARVAEPVKIESLPTRLPLSATAPQIQFPRLAPEPLLLVSKADRESLRAGISPASRLAQSLRPAPLHAQCRRIRRRCRGYKSTRPVRAFHPSQQHPARTELLGDPTPPPRPGHDPSPSPRTPIASC